MSRFHVNYLTAKLFFSSGFEALEELELAIEKGQSGKFADLTSKFYTIIPHNFGRSIPPVIRTIETVQAKYDMLAVSLKVLSSFTPVRIGLHKGLFKELFIFISCFMPAFYLILIKCP